MNYLSPTEILYIHNRLTAELGSKQGVADIKVLKKAAGYIHNNEMFPDKYSKAAALLFAIARRKPFSDSNIPTAFFATQLFLFNNKVSLDLSNPEIPTFNRIFLPNAKLQEIKNFILQNSSPIIGRQS